MKKSQKLLPIGLSDFKQVIEGGYAYVDKSLLIQELMTKGGNVALIPRLRRFGKTLNLSMLRYFFEKIEHDTSYLFKSLKIWQDEKMRALQGQFPVIFITLKDLKHSSWKMTFSAFKRLISRAFSLHPYLMKDSILNETEKKDYQTIVNRKGDEALYSESLLLLTDWLHRYHQKRVILLIDEYDAPAHAAYLGGFYKQLIDFLRNWLSGGLKDNSALEKGVFTGILRIAKESIFSGLNNVNTFTILSEEFQDKFGLTESEVEALLKEYNMLGKRKLIKEWYNGYRIGSCEGIYNPWSVLNCIAKQGVVAPYWVNTSENSLMRELVTEGSEEFKADLEELVRGGVIEKTVEEGLVFSELEDNPDAVWSLLLFSGYLSLGPSSTPQASQLRIPNHEVRGLYTSIILKWFKQTLRISKYHLLLKSLCAGEIETFSELFEKFLLSAFSYFDVSEEEPEQIYHIFVLGVLIGLKDRYDIKSNRESGLGRYDVMLIPQNKKDLGIIFEFKTSRRKDKTDLESIATSALAQIKARKYDLELKERGVKRILHLGMAFRGKKVAIQSARV
jgi:predicted AAA-ATPase/PD-(D/E)XK nuclease superfamily protein